MNKNTKEEDYSNKNGLFVFWCLKEILQEKSRVYLKNVTNKEIYYRTVKCILHFYEYSWHYLKKR